MVKAKLNTFQLKLFGVQQFRLWKVAKQVHIEMLIW